MAEKEKSNNGSLAVRNPSKEQIIARLVQIRDYIIKAEDTKEHLQNDPKVFQLHDMISELRETEKRLLEMLRDFDRESSSPFQNSVEMDAHISPQSFPSNLNSTVDEAVQDFSMYGAHSANGVDPELLAERDKLFAQRDILDRRCQLSQQHIEALESERSYLLDLGQKLSEREKSSSVCSPGVKSSEVEMENKLLREIGSSEASRRCQSADEQPMSEELQEAEICCRNLSELQGKRFEIHKIMSEIALLRRAKDESSRKIDLLQQALSGNSSNTEIKRPEYTTPWSTEPKEDLSKIVQQLSLRDQNDASCNTTATSSEWNETFYRTFSGKLLEIQTMREKLEALQSLVHSIPTPSPNYQSLDNDIEFHEQSSNGCEVPKDVNSNELQRKVREIYRTSNGIRRGLITPSNTPDLSDIARSRFVLPMSIPTSRWDNDNDRGLNACEVAIDEVLNPDIRASDFAQNFQSCSLRSHDEFEDKYSTDGIIKKSRSRVNKKSRSRTADSKEESYRQESKSCQNNQQFDLVGHPFLYKPYEPNYFSPSSSGRTPNGNIERMLALRARNQNETQDIISQTGNNERSARSRDQRDMSLVDEKGNRGHNLTTDYVESHGSIWNWVPNAGGAQEADNGNQRKYQKATNNINGSVFMDRYMAETTTVLKHLVDSVAQILNGLSSQKNQLEILNFNMTKLAERVELSLSHSSNGTRPYSADRNIPTQNPTRARSNRERSFNSSAMNNEAPENPSLYDIGFPFYGYPFTYKHEEGRDLTKGVYGASSPGLRELWNGAQNVATTASGYPSEHPRMSTSYSSENLEHQSSATASIPVPNQDSRFLANVKRPWASPPSPGGTALNNQVPPGTINGKQMRPNNYWDNFRSQSRQNVLSSSSKSNGSSNSVVGINTEINNQPGGLTNNFNRRDLRSDKNPTRHSAAISILENIGSKKRNQEQQRQQMLPQRSVSVGSMHHSDQTSVPVAGPSHANRRRNGGEDGLDLSTVCLGMNKPFRQDEYNALFSSNKLQHHPEEINSLMYTHTQSGENCFTEMCQKLSQVKNDAIRIRTIDAVRKVVEQSVRQDELSNGESSSSSGVVYQSHTDMMNLPPSNCSGGAGEISTSSFNFNDLFGPVTSPTTNLSSPRMSNVNRETRRSDDAYVPSIIASFHAAQKSIAEAQSNSPVLESPTSRIGGVTKTTSRYGHEAATTTTTGSQFSENTNLTSTLSACKGDSYFNYECDLENGNDTVVTTPMRDLTVVEAHVDAGNRNNSSGSFSLASESSRPDVTSSTTSLTGFNKNCKYKGQLMSSTNNPWVYNEELNEDISSSFPVMSDERESTPIVLESTEISHVDSVEQSGSTEAVLQNSSEAELSQVIDGDTP